MAETTIVKSPETGRIGPIGAEEIAKPARPTGDSMLIKAIQKVNAGTVPAEALQEIMDHVDATQSGFHCPFVSAAGGLFYCNLSVKIEDGKGTTYDWNNNNWGIGTAGGGAGGGTLYTNYTMEGIARLTSRCSVTVTAVSVLATFHADDNTLLATLMAGGYFAPAYAFTGGGSGKWTK